MIHATIHPKKTRRARFSRYGTADETMTTVQGEVNLAVSISVLPRDARPLWFDADSLMVPIMISHITMANGTLTCRLIPSEFLYPDDSKYRLSVSHLGPSFTLDVRMPDEDKRLEPDMVVP